MGTQKGLVRGTNQDRGVCVKYIPKASARGEIILGVLSDGMGGMTDGERCAVIATSFFVAGVLNSNHQSLSTAMIRAAVIANEEIYQEYQGSGGATLSAVAISGNDVVAVNVGDSRVYTIRTGNVLTQTSRDDTVFSQLAALGERNENAKSDLIQFLGIGPDLSPNLYQFPAGDEILGLLLTSDGAHSIPGLLDVTKHAQKPRELVERILALSLWIGGRDNATALAITLKGRGHQRPLADGLIEITDSAGVLNLPMEYLVDEPSRPAAWSTSSPTFEARHVSDRVEHMPVRATTNTSLPVKETLEVPPGKDSRRRNADTKPAVRPEIVIEAVPEPPTVPLDGLVPPKKRTTKSPRQASLIRPPRKAKKK